MATLATLLVKLGLSAGDFHQGLDKAEKQATSSSGNIVSSLLKIGGAVAGFLAVKLGAEMLTGVFKDVVSEAMNAQNTEAQLDNVLKSTGAAAARQAAEYAAASGQVVSSTLLSAGALATLQGKLGDTQLKYATLTSSMQEQKQRIIDLTAQYGANGLATITAKNKLAEMKNEADKLTGSMADLSTQIGKGSVVTTQTLAKKLGLVSPAAQMTKAELLKLADALDDVTTFEDETVIAAEIMMLQFKTISKDVFPQAIELSLDLATRLGVDAAGGAQLLGKALVSPGEGLLRLKQAGISLTEAQEKQIDVLMKAGKTAQAQKLILDLLTESVGGAARAAGATADGQWKIFGNQMGNVKETIGLGLLPALKDAGTALNNAVQSPAAQAKIDAFAKGLGTIATNIGNVIAAVLTGDFSKLGGLGDALSPFVTAAKDLAAGNVGEAWSAFAAGIGEFAKHVMGYDAKKSADLAVDVFKIGNVAGTAATNVSNFVKGLADTAWQAASDWFATNGPVLQDNIGGIATKLGTLFSGITVNGPSAGTILGSTVNQALDDFLFVTQGLNGSLDSLNRLLASFTQEIGAEGLANPKNEPVWLKDFGTALAGQVTIAADPIQRITQDFQNWSLINKALYKDLNTDLPTGILYLRQALDQSDLQGALAPAEMAFTTFIANSQTAWARLVAEAKTGTGQLGTELSKVGPAISKGLSSGGMAFTTFIGEAQTFVRSIPTKIQENLGTWGEQLGKIGNSIIAGIKAGIEVAWDGFIGWVLGKMGGIIQAILDAIGAHSPADASKPVGKSLVQGIGEGWGDAWRAVRAGMVGDVSGLLLGGGMMPAFALASSGTLGGGSQGAAPAAAGASSGGDTINVYPGDQTSAALVMAWVDGRRRDRLNLSMGG